MNNSFEYCLGPARKMAQLYPPAKYANADLKFKKLTDVIEHYTKHSLKADGIKGIENVSASLQKGEYHIKIEGSTDKKILKSFAKRHVKVFGPDYAQKAIKGMKLMKKLGVWNPMKDYHVNLNPNDGTSKWQLFPPLGLNMIGQRGLLLMHYPPWAVLQAGSFDDAMTMKRWTRMLTSSGVHEDDADYYKTFIDVNPVAAPGSGESEYPNDYMPIMMASAFFDGPKDRDYIKSMLELFLNPPGMDKDSKYTLPLLICGSPLYDPQAPGWFRTAYTDILPQVDNIPQVNVLQAGKFKIFPDSKKETPYLIGNHMIAAGVTGKCTPDSSKMPDIRLYEAQDLVAATFLQLYSQNPDIDPEVAKAQACKRWFGNEEGTGSPEPESDDDKLAICALAQMDLFFASKPTSHPLYSYKEACERCKQKGVMDNPCFDSIKPTDPRKISNC